MQTTRSIKQFKKRNKKNKKDKIIVVVIIIIIIITRYVITLRANEGMCANCELLTELVPVVGAACYHRLVVICVRTLKPVGL